MFSQEWNRKTSTNMKMDENRNEGKSKSPQVEKSDENMDLLKDQKML
jgi:hypothetical protein